MRRASFMPPPGSVNAHCHVVGPRVDYPVDESHPMLPADSPASALFSLQDALGLDRVVIVQSLAHGFDHSAVTDAIAMRAETTRGIAMLRQDDSKDRIADLSSRGYVGARLHVVSHIPDAAKPEDLERVGHLCADAGWHVQLHVHGNELGAIASVLATMPCPVVIDHMAYPAPDLHADFLRAMDLPHVFAKISCPERVNKDDLRVGAVCARHLIERHADKLVWGNDWPHIGLDGVDDFALLDLLADYPADHLDTILIDTPDSLYFKGGLR